MVGASPLDFTMLKKGFVLGPNHHQFRLLKPVSNSPIGQVWHAQDLSTGSKEKEPEKVALEIFNPQLIGNINLDIFKSQVTQCKQLDSPHIANTYGYFTSREGWLFVAMEPVPTRSLARILMEDGYQQLSIKKIRIILSQVAKALDYAHSRKLTHGDLTPWNILISPGTGAVLVNYAFRQSFLAQIQRQGMRLLNTEYHAPEAYESIPMSSHSDIYSFGCIAYQLFDGKPPFSPDQPMDSRDIEELEAPKQLSDEQWNVLKTALSANPKDRPKSAVKLLEALFPTNLAPEEQSLTTADAGSTPASDTRAASGSSLDRGSAGLETHLNAQLKRTLTWAMLFSCGLIIGFVGCYYYLTQQHNTEFAKLIEIQDILNQPINDNSHIALSRAVAEFKHLSDDEQLIAVLEVQTSRRKEILQNPEPAAPPAPPLPIEVTEVVKKPPVTETTDTAAAAATNNSGVTAGYAFRDSILEDVYGPTMVVMPKGSFSMGAQTRRGDDNEYPAHKVNIQHNFALSQHEVTFAQYDVFALSTQRPLPSDNGWGRGNRPVINISWNDANAYAHWIEEQTGQPYRLPTEAEWEYAARAGTYTSYWWGNDKGRNQANCDDCGSDYDGLETAPVGSFKANPFGLHDMNGNVYEWVSDCYNETYEGAPDDGSSWNVGQCNLRVMRGGSWYDISRLARSASRYRHPPDSSRNAWGFRLALDLDPKPE